MKNTIEQTNQLPDDQAVGDIGFGWPLGAMMCQDVGAEHTRGGLHSEGTDLASPHTLLPAPSATISPATTHTAKMCTWLVHGGHVSGVRDELHVADGLFQAVHATLLQQLPHNLVGHLLQGPMEGSLRC